MADDVPAAKLFGEALALRAMLAQLCCRVDRIVTDQPDAVLALWYRDTKRSVEQADILADTEAEADWIRRYAQNAVDDVFLGAIGAQAPPSEGEEPSGGGGTQ